MTLSPGCLLFLVALFGILIPSFSAVIPLDTAMEVNLCARQEPPIATLTWFGLDDTHNQNSNDIVKALRQKTLKVLQHNPWSTGSVSGCDPFSVLVRQQPAQLEYQSPDKNDRDELMPKVFCRVKLEQDKDQLSLSTPVSDLYTLTAPYTTLDPTNGPLCRLTVLEQESDSNNHHLAIIFTLSHAVADMTAYYTLLDMMLSSQHKAEPLSMEAIPAADDQARQALGGPTFDLAHHVLANLVKGARGLVDRIITGRPGKAQWYRVDADAMAKAKKQALSDDDCPTSIRFVSTNDVLTSHFFRTCGADLGLLCANYRSTVLKTQSPLGRNRWGTLVYRTPEEATKPWKIRQSLKQWQNDTLAQHLGNVLPSPLAFAFNNDRVAVASSWVQTDPPWDLAGKQRTFMAHVPLYDFASYAPSGFCVMRTFTSRRNETAVYVAGDATMVEQFQSRLPPFLRPLAKCQ